VPKTYTYTPGGERLSQASTSSGTTTTGYYSYNDHNDVEAVTGSQGTTTSTYGYTAYGQPIASQFTGADKNNANPGPTTQPFNSYRFNAMRWDSSSGQYDMGFRDYDAGLNQFLSRDMYDGALSDMDLTTDPYGADADGDVLGMVGWILLYIDAQRHGGIFTPSGCRVIPPDPARCPPSSSPSIRSARDGCHHGADEGE
jgi:RHS repeat-associated protein